jgi:hypothetical protein
MEGNFGSPQRIETGSACVSRLDSGQLNLVCPVFGMLVGYVTVSAPGDDIYFRIWENEL